MRQRNLISTSIRPTLIRLALSVALSCIAYACTAQAPVPPPLPPVQPPPPPVVAAPPKVGPGKVTTASFYGSELHGHETSSGEIYNENAMTAASRTLPIGSHAKVTNLKTGKSVVVRINDHGPFVKGRGIDLSRAAAHELGIDHRGVARVRVARVEVAPGAADDSWSGTVNVSDNSSAPAAGSANSAGTAATDHGAKPATATNPPVAEAGVVPTASDSSGSGSWTMELASPTTPEQQP
jgi:rare lipoprotein A (peptidoglycan hydrolase)